MIYYARASRLCAIAHTSGFIGIDLEGSRWRARAQVNDRRLHLGLFETAIEAAIAYDDCVRATRGEYGVTNESSYLLDAIEAG